MSATPVRTCVGCRQRAAKQDLLRVVVQDLGHGPQVVPDPAGRADGRGAYLHPTTVCLDHAVRRRAFARALRAPVSPDVERLREHLADHPAAGDQK
jgi:predicted RNA-binding protein YlxR (DUF448 family)